VPVRGAGNRRPARLHRSRLPAPLHLAGSLLRYPMLSPADRLRAVAGALAMRRLDGADPANDAVCFGDWLDRHGQNRNTVAALWDLFTVATLNLPAGQASLTMAAKVFQTGLLTDASAGDIGWSRIPLQQLHAEPAERALVAAGAEIRTRSRVVELAPDGAGWLIRDSAGRIERARQVVLAVPPDQAERLLPAGALDLPAGWSDRLGSSPIVNVHLVFDRPVLAEPFLAAVFSPVQWIFDRTGQSGLAEQPQHGQYLAISLSAAAELIDTRTADLRAWVLPALAELLPETRTAGLLDFFVTRERHATFRAAPGSGRLRPSAGTGLPGLALAGAWTATGWPATMESAALSGEAAAELLLAAGSSPPRTLAASERNAT
jgi:squalene-associated FAD-dependent desaturase